MSNQKPSATVREVCASASDSLSVSPSVNPSVSPSMHSTVCPAVTTRYAFPSVSPPMHSTVDPPAPSSVSSSALSSVSPSMNPTVSASSGTSVSPSVHSSLDQSSHPYMSQFVGQSVSANSGVCPPGGSSGNDPQVTALLQQVVQTQQEMVAQQNQLFNFLFSQQVAAQSSQGYTAPPQAYTTPLQRKESLQKQPRQGKFHGKCYSCGKYGNHKARDCPKKKQKMEQPGKTAWGNALVPQLGVGLMGHMQPMTHPSWLDNHQ